MRQQRDYRNTCDNDFNDDVEATDADLKGVAYTFIGLLAFLLCVIGTMFLVVWEISK